MATAGSALAMALLGTPPSHAQAGTSQGAEVAAPEMTPYQQHVARTVTEENWHEVERKGYQAQRDRANFEVRSQGDLTIYERRDLDRQGRVAQRARGARLPTHAAAEPSFRDHAARLGTDPHWNAVEQRGVQAQRNRAGFEIRSAADLTAQERLELDRQGRAAQRARGARLPTQPVSSTRATIDHAQTRRTTPSRLARTSNTPLRPATGAGTTAAGLKTIARRADKMDFAAEAFGGRDLGLGRYGSDMTIGQVSNTLQGGDPVIAAAHATRRLGRNLNGGLTGIGQSIIDPRRIPGNTARAVNGVANGAVQTVGWAGKTAVNTTRDVGRALTDPAFAKKKTQEAGKTLQNVGQSICKGLAWVIPSNTNRKKAC